MDLHFRFPSSEEFGRVSEQIALSYVSAYRGLWMILIWIL